MTARTPEGRLKEQCRTIAKANGLFIWSIDGKSINGVPDTICSVKGGGICFIEFKRPGGGVLSEQQKRRIAELRDAGSQAEVVDNVEAYKWFVGL